MKYTPENYARALLASMDTGAPKEAVLKRFVASVWKHGDGHQLGKIVQTLERLMAKKDDALYVEIESARPLSEKALTSLKRGFSATDSIATRIKPSLVAGVRVIIDDSWVVDATLKRRLEQLFNK